MVWHHLILFAVLYFFLSFLYRHVLDDFARVREIYTFSGRVVDPGGCYPDPDSKKISIKRLWRLKLNLIRNRPFERNGSG